MLRFVLALVAFSGTVCAQSGEPGYVVVQGDTLRAEVEIGTEFDASRGLRYRTASGEWEQADPPAVEAFGTDAGRRYRRRQLRLALGAAEDSSTPVERLAFARVVRDGPASLLALEVSPGAPLFFVETESSGPVGLYRVQDQIERRNGLRQRDVALYRQTLTVVLAGCDTDAARVEDLPYTEAALASVVDDYNRCTLPSYVPTVVLTSRRSARLGAEFGVGVGSGSFGRRQTFPGVPEDPRAGGIQVRAAGTVGPLFGTRSVTARLGIDYQHHMLRARRSATEQDDISPLHIDLGIYFTLPVGPLGLDIGGGVLAGAVLRSTRSATPEQIATANRFIIEDFSTGSGGQYVEVGLRHRAYPVAVRVRGQSLGFTSGDFFIPAVETGNYTVRGVAVAVVASL